MPHFIPFKAIRPPREYVHLVGSRSYMNYSQEDILARLDGNPYSFLHVIMSEEMTLKGDDLSLEEKFSLVKEKFDDFVEQGFLVKDKKDSFYLYKQTKDDHIVVGIIGGIAAEDYNSGHIKKHEQTITKREELFKKYLEITGFNAEPVLLTYEDCDNINAIIDKYLKKRPEYIFATTDKVKHEFWVIKKSKHKRIIQEEFSKVDDVYIADGHHRCASSALVAEPGLDNVSQNHFMALMVPKSRLKILDYNRLVKDLNSHSTSSFMAAVKERFVVNEIEPCTKPTKGLEISMFLDDKWHNISIKPEFIPDTVVGQLDTRILTEQLLSPILGIEDLKTDSRIDFIDGTYGMEGIEKAVNKRGFKVGFGLFPVSFDQLKEVSDNDKIMPPKSTWIEPKLRSGIIVYEIFE